MSWSAGADVSTGDLITASTWNNYLGDSGSIEYLKTEADKLDDCSQQTQADFTPNRALNTIYQNTSGKIKIVTISFDSAVGSGIEYIYAYVENNADPTAVAAATSVHEDYSNRTSLTFVVPPGWYYKALNDDVIIEYWTEWDLH